MSRTKRYSHMTTDELVAALQIVLRRMDIPEMRNDMTVGSNIRWVDRNIYINNRSHPDYQEARDLLDTLLERYWKLYRDLQ